MSLAACVFLFVLAIARGEVSTVSPQSNDASVSSNNTRIVGGQIVQDRRQFPYQVSLRSSSGSPFCGASIIDEQHLLTAAHCVSSGKTVVSASNIKAVVGDLNTNVVSSTTATYNIKYIFVHEKYNATGIQNDVAVLRVAKNLTLNEYVNKINLSSTTPQHGLSCVVSGWGTTQYEGYVSADLRYVNVPIVSQQICNASYANLREGMLCAGNLTHGGKDACQGDSGGPLVCSSTLAGIVSWGYNCAEAYYPGVYTDVSVYTSWIRTQQQRASSNVLTINAYLVILGTFLYSFINKYNTNI